MAKLTLASPLTADARQGVGIHIRSISVDNNGNAIGVVAELRDVNGVVLLTKNFQFQSAGVTAWIRSIEPDALALVQAELAIAGTIG